MLFPGGMDRRATGDYALVQDAIKVIEQRERSKPFCIFLALLQTHPPYMAPAGFDKMYKPRDLPQLVPPDLPKKPSYFGAIRRAYHLDKAPDALLREVRATYYGQVSYADWLLGELLAALERTDHAKDTAIVASADHGDYAGDYGLVEKWPSGLESCLTHVPLIGRLPGGAASYVVPNMVELFDIMPTFLSVAGTEAKHTNFARSLSLQFQGDAGDPNRASYSEGGYDVYEPQAFEPRQPGLYGPKTKLENDQPQTVTRCAAVKTKDYSYVARPNGQSELYDRKLDSMETRNLIDDEGVHEIREQMEALLLNRYIDTTGIPPKDKDPRGLPPDRI